MVMCLNDMDGMKSMAKSHKNHGSIYDKIITMGEDLFEPTTLQFFLLALKCKQCGWKKACKSNKIHSMVVMCCTRISTTLKFQQIRYCQICRRCVEERQIGAIYY